MIPKIIHQTPYDENLDLVVASQKYIKETNPDWDYKFWSNSMAEELVFNEYPEFSKAWNSIPNSNIIKWNLLRFMIIHTEGGLYVDSDTIFKKNIDKILDLNYNFIGIKKHKINNWVKDHFFASEKKSNFLYHCIHKIIDTTKNYNVSNVSVHDVCGGIFLYNELNYYFSNNNDNSNYNLLDCEFVTNIGLNYEGYKNASEENKKFKWENVYVIHLLDGSWLK